MVILMGLDISNNQYLKKLDKSQPIICAVSGGVDSMVLLDLLLNAGYEVIIAHVNHHKREESEIEEQALRALASKNNMMIYVYDYHHTNDNFQAQARTKRYDFFYELYKKHNASAIITAHHAIDNLETIVMNLIRGSNLYGYAGIAEQTFYQDALVIRPLIKVNKDELYTYAENNKLMFFEDSSNASDDYLRNRIRHHIIPLLKDENPNLDNNVANYSLQLLEAFEFIRSQSVVYWQEHQKIKIDDFNKMPKALQSDLINYILESHNITSSYNKINDIIDLLLNEKPNLSYDIGEGYQLVKNYCEATIRVKFIKPQLNLKLSLGEEIKVDKHHFYFSNQPIEKAFRVSIDEKFPLTIRHRQDGDKLIINDGHQKLKDFCINKKIPLQERDKLIIVTNADNEIIWVMNHYQKKYQQNAELYLIYEEEKNGKCS